MKQKKIDSLLTKIDWDRSLHERGWAVWANDATGESVEAALSTLEERGDHLGVERNPFCSVWIYRPIDKPK